VSRLSRVYRVSPFPARGPAGSDCSARGVSQSWEQVFSVKMKEPEIDTVIWRQLGSLIEVIYADWRVVHRRGDRLAATELAQEAGLQVVPAPEGMAKWVRGPGSQRVPPGVVS